jgi:aminoglycoside 3-N-acetyltransferase
MNSYRDLFNGLSQLGIERHQPVMVHVAESSYEKVKGGAETILTAILAAVDDIIAPSFTHQTLIIPKEGPLNNAMEYGIGDDVNASAEFYYPNLPPDQDLGRFIEVLRKHPQARRSDHPILSFVGVGVDMAIRTQNWSEPLSTIGVLRDLEGWVLLVGGDHALNFSLHFAERIARRKQFIRWALTPNGIVECPNIPGCSRGFNAIDAHASEFSHMVELNGLCLRAFPLKPLLETATSVIKNDPFALLCDHYDCLHCESVRQSLKTV